MIYYFEPFTSPWLLCRHSEVVSTYWLLYTYINGCNCLLLFYILATSKVISGWWGLGEYACTIRGGLMWLLLLELPKTTRRCTASHFFNWVGWLLEFYILATSKVISGWVLTCDSLHSGGGGVGYMHVQLGMVWCDLWSKELIKLNMWFGINKLSLNVSKTNFILLLLLLLIA